MSTRSDFSDLLVRDAVLTPEQAAEARAFCTQSGISLADCVVKLGYATSGTVLKALAEFHGLLYLDLSTCVIPLSVIELIPESVARENIILPVAVVDNWVVVATFDPADFDMVQKLQFILNKNIRVVLSPREQIIEAINRHYGNSETDSVDSMLSEFTDTAIDFTEMDILREPDFPTDLAQAATKPSGTSPPVERRATVRYYDRMNPERMVPLMVVLSKREIEKVVKRAVSQGQSEKFRVNLGSVVEVEPVLPGCACYPPRDQVEITQQDAVVRFQVVPHVLGRITGARVVIRQGGKTLAEVPLETCVTRQLATAACGVLSLLLPFVLLLLKQFRLDFETQMQEGFGLYAQLAAWVLGSLSPEVLFLLLLGATGGLYLWLRPRERDVFWDVKAIGPDQPDETIDSVSTMPPAGEANLGPARVSAPRSELIALGEKLFKEGNLPEALRCYEGGLDLVYARAAVYHHASVAAFRLGDHRRALAILREAEARLDPTELSPAMLYNMGCCAARLGWIAQAIRYLGRAADAGYTDAEKYRGDPDLAILRWRPEFKQFVMALERV
jgi:MshEN domain